ncbi:hypothetical protein J4453_02030 [Candidatus Woesearchaeota archaeon]|nr:hypothetical protein [Candidatus Woesearchaeota archaeon]
MRIMETTTIKIQEDTKLELDKFREYKNESYDEVIKKMVYIAKNVVEQPKLSKEAVIAIERARERIKAGNFVTEAEARKRLGF